MLNALIAIMSGGPRRAFTHDFALLAVSFSSLTQPLPVLTRSSYHMAAGTWPVRIASCASTARLAQAFPDAAKQRLDDVTAILYHHLSDNTWSVREEAAISLGILSKTYGVDYMSKVASIPPR